MKNVVSLAARLGHRPMPDISQLRNALITRILQGAGAAPREQRRAAFDNNASAEPQRTLIDKVATRSSAISDADISAVKAAGLSEDQIFELVICAAVGQASRECDAALAALNAATGTD